MKVMSVRYDRGEFSLVPAREMPEDDLGRRVAEAGVHAPLAALERVAFYGTVPMGTGVVTTPCHAYEAADYAASTGRLLLTGTGPVGDNILTAPDLTEAKRLCGVWGVGDVTHALPGPAQAVATAMAIYAASRERSVVAIDEGTGGGAVGVALMARYLRAFCPWTSAESRWSRAWFSKHGLYPRPGGPPLRAPHHTVSEAAMKGRIETGTDRLQPGEVHLSWGGVMMLDEIDQFSTSSLPGRGEHRARFTVGTGSGPRLRKVAEKIGADALVSWPALARAGVTAIPESDLMAAYKGASRVVDMDATFRGVLSAVLSWGWGTEVAASAEEAVE